MPIDSTTTRSTRHTEVDTARRYGNGTSETMLGELKCQERGVLVGTKNLPTAHSNPVTAIPDDWSTHSFLYLQNDQSANE
jgi:aryl-alcohol dehydrogenase-like predicted oxidoreductase